VASACVTIKIELSEEDREILRKIVSLLEQLNDRDDFEDDVDLDPLGTDLEDDVDLDPLGTTD
jgi:hypothetical protein